MFQTYHYERQPTRNNNNCGHLSPILFCIPKGIQQKYQRVRSCCNLSSDHLPVLTAVSTQFLNGEVPPTLGKIYTYQGSFVNTKSRIKFICSSDIDQAIENINQTIRDAVSTTTNKTTYILGTVKRNHRNTINTKVRQDMVQNLRVRE